jgi:hypothetical protein
VLSNYGLLAFVKAFPPRIMTNAGVILQQRSLRPAFPVYILDSTLSAHDPDGMAWWAHTSSGRDSRGVLIQVTNDNARRRSTGSTKMLAAATEP